MIVSIDSTAVCITFIRTFCTCIVVVIGFEQTTYTTVENDTRVVMVCASIRPGSPELDKTVVVNLTSSDGTATGKQYNSHMHCENVHIMPPYLLQHPRIIIQSQEN